MATHTRRNQSTHLLCLPLSGTAAALVYLNQQSKRVSVPTFFSISNEVYPGGYPALPIKEIGPFDSVYLHLDPRVEITRLVTPTSQSSSNPDRQFFQ